MLEVTVNLQLQIPDTLNISEFDIKMFIAAKLYEGGKLSLGYAADAAGVSKRTFIELLSQYGVSVFDRTPEELQSDIENARCLV